MLVALVAVVALASCGPENGDLPRGVAVAAGRAPELAGPAIAGRLPPAQGRVVVVNFWNPYCPPCRVEAPVLEAAARRYAGRGVVVVGVHYTGQQWPKSVPAALSFLRAAHLTYPVIGDPGARMAMAFGIRGIPSTVIVDGRGNLRFRVLGRLRTPVLDGLLGRVLGWSAGSPASGTG
ncbi:MAG: TlpA family protein disulfide reductase [Actinomycetota bacterium]